jgi:BirA family transcriptional regulator, biotin operon repressor / biotin---[acetyl-CoA-carboxylase] ligase
MIIGSKRIFLEKVSSTNTHSSSLLRKGPVQEGTIVHTNFQTAGRGQPGNTWESQYGKNLLFSIILYPVTVVADKQFVISKMISLGIRDYLITILPDVHIKWPNDIYVSSDKIAGILIENSVNRSEIEYTIAGIGLNVNQDKFSGAVPNATSLKKLTGKDSDLDNCLAELSKAIDLRYKQMLYEKETLIDNDYLSALYRYGEYNGFRDSNGTFEGKIIAVTGTGRLQIEDRRGRILEYGFKEVDFIS